MKIWIITTGEPITVVDGENIRPWRSTLLTDMLLSMGHSVTRWAGTFDHSNKKNRFNTNTLITINNQYNIQFFYSSGYNKNISVKRLLDHQEGALFFKNLINNVTKPDLILCSLPTLELCEESVRYAKENNIPIVLDIRDLWPDIFLEIIPSILKPIIIIFLKKYYNSLIFSCTNATAISGISSDYIEWGIKFSGRKRRETDCFFPHGYLKNSINNKELVNAEFFWNSFNFIFENDFIICLFSSLGNVIDINPIIEAAIRFEKEKIPIKFILCGDGVRLNKFKKLTKKCTSILMPGWIDKTQIQYLMKISKLGILPYKNLDNYKMNIPNKPIEYLSAGLPVITSVSGLLKQTIEVHVCGEFYTSSIKFELYNKIYSFYKDTDKLNLFSKNALSLYNSKFNSINVYKNMAIYLENIKRDFNEKL
jgi:glycosyltransferase involved in cell wall biosynthesis